MGSHLHLRVSNVLFVAERPILCDTKVFRVGNVL